MSSLCPGAQSILHIPRKLRFPQRTEKINMKSDMQLEQDVLEELKWEPSVNAADVGVEVKDGIVTLAGQVSSFSEKWGAEQAAQRVSGVKGLAIEMDVNLFGLGKRSDADIAHAAENVLEWLTVLPKDSVKVIVENGWITLSGEVEWQYQRETVIGAVRHLMGVRGVSDQITIEPKLSLSTLGSEIEAALAWRAVVNAPKISVKVNDSDVTLTGKVNTWAEHDLALACAWSTPGIRKVIDDITVVH